MIGEVWYYRNYPSIITTVIEIKTIDFEYHPHPSIEEDVDLYVVHERSDQWIGRIDRSVTLIHTFTKIYERIIKDEV